MNLNNISLKPHLLADLYTNVLVETNATPMPNVQAKPEQAQVAESFLQAEEATKTITAAAKPMVAEEPVNFKALGANAKNILIVVNKTDSVFLPDGELHFLTQVLGACKLSLADVAIINLQNIGTTDYKKMVGHFNSKNVLLFNIDPVDLGLPLSFPQFQVQRFDNRIYIHAPELRLIESDVALKKQLWTSLKTLFSL